jgi:hypothetical protein
MVVNAKKVKRIATREDTHQIAGHFSIDTMFAWRELLVRTGRKKGRRVTTQEALGEAIRDYFEKSGIKPPRDLTNG